MAGSGSSYSSGSASYSGSAAGKGTYGKNSLSGSLAKYGISNMPSYLTGLGKLYSGSKNHDSCRISGVDSKNRLLDFLNPQVSSLFKKRSSYDLEAIRPKRLIDLEEYLDKEVRKYKKKCPNCGIDVSGISYSMN